MAVYGRFKERWNPTKVKSKVSKNLTYELDGTTSKVLFWMNVESYNGADAFLGAKGEDNGLIDIPLDSHGDFEPTIAPVKGAQFHPNALHFDKISTQRSYVQTGQNEMSFTGDDIAGEGRTHDTWISYWVYIYQDNFDGSVGHNMGGLYRSLNNSPAEDQGLPNTNPFCLFGITSSGAPELTFFKDSDPGDRIRYNGDVTPSDKNIEPNEWTLVSWLIKVPEQVPAAVGTTKLYSDMVELYIDGQHVPVAAVDEGNGNPNSTSTVWWDGDQLEVLLGNQTRGYAADNSGTQGEGFWGAIGEFLIFTQPEGDTTTRSNMAKFIYEAQREGAYHLHSGIHNSSPRLEQLDLDRDSAYPPNFSMPAYTNASFGTSWFEQDEQVLRKSTERFTEGYKSTETWEEKAGKYFVNKNEHTLPHLRLHFEDSILTNGEWYSDARSEFFSEDLDEFDPANNKYGFTVNVQTSDEIYREHVSQNTISAYRDVTAVDEEYRDVQIIEIPLPNAAALTLSTDNPNERAQLQSNYTGNTFDDVTQQDPLQAINTMAYYNFETNRWEHTTPSWSTSVAHSGDASWVEDADIGFSPMSGLVFPVDETAREYYADSYGRPMSDFGFPFHNKFASDGGQTIDLSQYIDEEVILEGWEIATPCIPVVGYQQEVNSNSASNTITGPSGFYNNVDPSGGQSPFFFGGHGEAAVIWNPASSPTPFVDEYHSMTTNPRYNFLGTIPVSEYTGTTEQVPNHTSPGLVTKGITAFLLKEKSIGPTTTEVEQKWKSEAHNVSFSFNSGYGIFNSNAGIYEIGTEKDIRSSNDWSGAAYEQPFDTSSDFASPTKRELIGYLQHVFHNDTNPLLERNEYQRKLPYIGTINPDDPPTPVGEDIKWTDSIVNLLDRENQTYVSNLLRVNHTDQDEHILRVMGSTKQVTPYSAGVPISNFRTVHSISNYAQVTNAQKNALGNFQATKTTEFYFLNQSIRPSSQGDLGNEFVSYDVQPTIVGKGPERTVQFPEMMMPVSGTIGSDWATNVYPELVNQSNVTLNPDPEVDVVLKPTDKLILGIQDSVSTTIGSQQSVANGGDYGFVRWGRNSLTIPENQQGYLRLYIRKTRNDNTYNVASGESIYNQNVNRDLGDHDINDRFFIDDPLIYSGSTADDIIGPTTFTPPIIRTEVTWTHSGDSLLQQLDGSPSAGGGSFWNCARTVGEGLGNGYFEVVPDFGGNVTIDGNHVPLSWASCSDLVFKDRGQTTLPRRPAVEWKDPNGYDKQNTSAQSGLNSDGIWSGNHWQNIYEAQHWIITKQNPQAPAGESAHNNSRRVTGNSRVIPFRPSPMGYIEELCPNDGAPTTNIATVSFTNSLGVSYSLDQTLVGDNSPTLSAWNLRVLLPIFLRSSTYNFLGAGVTALQVEFRLVKIDSRDTDEIQTGSEKVAGIRPTIDGTELKLGDAFYFDDNNDPVLLSLDKSSLMSTLGGLGNQAATSDQRWARKAAFLRSDNMIRIFIVAGEVAFSGGVYDRPSRFVNEFDPTVGQRGYLNNSEVFAIASRVIDIQCSIDESILGSVNDAWDGTTLNAGNTNNYETPQGVEVLRPDISSFTSFSLDLPKDPIIRGQFSEFEQSINDTIDFKLCGLSMRGLTNDYPITSFTEQARRDQLDPSGSSFIIKGLYDALYLYDPDGAIVGVPGHDFSGEIANGMLHADNVTQVDTNWFGDYFKFALDTTDETESSIFFESAKYGTAEADEIEPGHHQTNAMYRISYRGLDTSAPQLRVIAETYNETIGRRIDRFVQRRSTSTNTESENGPLKAGPFGSLNKSMNLKSNTIYLDSLAPSSLVGVDKGYCATGEHGTKSECEAAHADQWVETDYVTTLADLPTHFPWENGADISKISTKGVRVKMLLNPNGNGASDANTSTIDITDNTGTDNVGVFTWGNMSFAENVYDEGGLGLLGVTNYIQKDFKGNSDFSGKTVKDYFLGFGNGVSGKLLFRPSISEYFSYTQSTPARFSTEWIMDPPRGSRFGLLNTHPISPSYHFSYSHFGHLRDMLEQALDSKVSGAGSNTEIAGPAVVINPTNPTNPEVPKLMENTSRYNKTTDCTIVKPYIEDNYEGIPNPVNLQSEKLRVDVAGSIKSKQILAPGNVASNIRRR